MCLGYSVSALHSDRGVLQSGALRVLSCWCVCRRIYQDQDIKRVLKFGPKMYSSV
jgi:hypothetical protein